MQSSIQRKAACAGVCSCVLQEFMLALGTCAGVSVPSSVPMNHRALVPSLALLAVACGSDPAASIPVDAPLASLEDAPLPSAATPPRDPRGAIAIESAAASTKESASDDPVLFTPERKLADKLGLPPRFAIGLGNDAADGPASAHAYALSSKVDIHYLYLSGLDWPAWSAGSYVTAHAQEAKTRGVVPMFTLYQAAAWGEANLGAFASSSFMTKYWANVRTLFTKLGAFGSAAIVHVEPDFWGYAQKHGGDDPSKVNVLVGSLVPECKSLPETVAGFGKCIVTLARTLAPLSAVGLSASSFGAFTNGVSDPVRIGAYLDAVGGDASDFVVVETLDRDAGCFERASDPLCQRTGKFYWDEKGFHDHLAWAAALRKRTKKPLLWWQMPLGVPSATSGGSAGRYRDNRVRYLFTHPDEFVAAGGFGAVFGTGAPNQTTVKTDGGQFDKALATYLASPVALP